MGKEKLLTLSFQDADIQRMVEERMTADETLTRAAAIRAVYTEMLQDLESVKEQVSFLRNVETEKEEWYQTAVERATEISRLNEKITQLVDELGIAKSARESALQLAESYKTTSLFHGLPEDAVEYMQAFFDELVGEGHYPSPQVFMLDLLRRVQEGAKTFIPNSKQTVKKEWIHQ